MAHKVVATGLDFPEGPAFDRDGNLYITESGTGRVVSLEWERPGMVLFPDR